MNTAAAVAAIIECHGAVLVAVRRTSPAAGKLDLPGGFVDYGETAEQALRRKLEEELGLKAVAPSYFGAYPNIYSYKSVEYHTLDLIFAMQLGTMPNIVAADDVAAIKWIAKSDLKIRDFGFSSIRAALSAYVKTTRESG